MKKIAGLLILVILAYYGDILCAADNESTNKASSDEISLNVIQQEKSQPVKDKTHDEACGTFDSNITDPFAQANNGKCEVK